jgi:hypothetical protein
MKLTFTKEDARHCKAVIKIIPAYYGNLTIYTATVTYKDRGTSLFNIKTNVDRLSKEDAYQDAIQQLNENGNWV